MASAECVHAVLGHRRCRLGLVTSATNTARGRDTVYTGPATSPFHSDLVVLSMELLGGVLGKGPQKVHKAVVEPVQPRHGGVTHLHRLCALGALNPGTLQHLHRSIWT